MKINFIGTGTMGSTTRCNTSILVDDILFDIGMGTVKQIERLKLYTKSINYLVISHFHADHFLDIPNLLIGRGIRKETENKLIILGPVGTREKTIKLMNFTHSDGDKHKYDNIEEKYNIKFIELSNEEQYNTEHHIIPKTISKEIKEVVSNEIENKAQKPKMSKKEKENILATLEEEMKEAASNLDFERAMELRDILLEMKSN